MKDFKSEGVLAEIRVDLETIKGDLDGDGADEIAVKIACYPTEGKVLLDQAFLVFTGHTGTPTFMGAVNARFQQQTSYNRVGIVDKLQISPSTITSDELVFRPDDAECCPTGRAVATWVYTSGALSFMNVRECGEDDCS
ncbi:hypothetical protein [Amycolatopsis sp. lyj-23]|uniref:hypothetical protein n=1 Tax=Amycolatopsis sp. lyj-23 TaxID=2789283 RepID=UPI00397CBA19